MAPEATSDEHSPTPLKKYRRKAGQTVLAIQLNLEISGLEYHKWGDIQHAKAGDWLVDNNGDVYTVDQQVFSETYREIAPATFEKVTPVWARKAEEAGSVETSEGRSHYRAGDYLVANNESGKDAWSVSTDKFEEMYEAIKDV